MIPVHTILFPTDFSPQSESAFRLACSLARDYGAELHVLHVWRAPAAVYAEGGLLVMDVAEEQEKMRSKLDELEPVDPAIYLKRHFVEGEPSREILRLAKEIQSDVIVMGTHGRTGMSRLLLGSVAEAIVRRATCPVVTIKTPLAEVKEPTEEFATAAGI